jgi:hypothetical protein
MPRRQRAELFVRGRVKEDPSSDKKGRLTLQAAQVWEERDRRPDAAHRMTSFANATSKFKCRPLAHLLVSRFLQRNPDFGHPRSAKSATSHACNTWPALILATRLALAAHSRKFMEPKACKQRL